MRYCFAMNVLDLLSECHKIFIYWSGSNLGHSYLVLMCDLLEVSHLCCCLSTYFYRTSYFSGLMEVQSANILNSFFLIRWCHDVRVSKLLIL